MIHCNIFILQKYIFEMRLRKYVFYPSSRSCGSCVYRVSEDSLKVLTWDGGSQVVPNTRIPVISNLRTVIAASLVLQFMIKYLLNSAGESQWRTAQQQLKYYIFVLSI